MMRQGLAGLLLVLILGCAQSASEATNRVAASGAEPFEGDGALRAELLVARDLLQRGSTGLVIIDSMYAMPGQAPGSPTQEMRPAGRTRSLRDSLNVRRAPGEAFIVRLSKPELRDERVRITATIDFPSQRQPGGRGYETVEYTLEGGSPAWTIRSRVQLGIT